MKLERWLYFQLINIFQYNVIKITVLITIFQDAKYRIQIIGKKTRQPRRLFNFNKLKSFQNNIHAHTHARTQPLKIPPSCDSPVCAGRLYHCAGRYGQCPLLYSLSLPYVVPLASSCNYSAIIFFSPYLPSSTRLSISQNFLFTLSC